MCLGYDNFIAVSHIKYYIILSVCICLDFIIFKNEKIYRVRAVSSSYSRIRKIRVYLAGRQRERLRGDYAEIFNGRYGVV